MVQGFKDQLQRTIPVKETPKRIVSLVPSQTELLYDLGLEKRIVGVTKFCVHPTHLKASKEIVGGTKQVKVDKIKALQPDIILCNKEENTKAIVEELMRIAPVHVSDIYNIEDSLVLIEQYGKLFNCEQSAAKIKDKILFGWNDFQHYIKNKPIRKIAYFIWKDPWMVAANNTFINYLLEINHFSNVYDNKERYPEIDIKSIGKTVYPELILLSSEPYPFKQKHIEEIKQYQITSKVVLVDGEYFSWYGSRLINAFKYFKDLHVSLEN